MPDGKGLSAHDCPWPRALAPGVQRLQKCRRFHGVLWAYQRAALSRSHRIRSGVPSPMASTAPPAVCRPCFRGRDWGYCLRHALNKLPDKLVGLDGTGAPGFTRQVSHRVASLSPAHKLTGGGVGPTPTPLCRLTSANTVGEDHGKRVATGFGEEVGLDAVLEDPQMPAMKHGTRSGPQYH